MPGPFRPPARRSLADMANEQLGAGRPRDRLSDGMTEAGRADCLEGGKQGAAGGLLAGPAVIARAIRGDCPK